LPARSWFVGCIQKLRTSKIRLFPSKPTDDTSTKSICHMASATLISGITRSSHSLSTSLCRSSSREAS
jgi:hypothetical protein